MRTPTIISYTILGLLCGCLLQAASAQDAPATNRYPLREQPSIWDSPTGPTLYQTVFQDPQANSETAQSMAQSVRNAQAGGQNAQNVPAAPIAIQGPGFTSDLQDPVVNLQNIRQMREQAKTPTGSLFRRSPLTPWRERAIAWEKRVYAERDIKFGANLNTLFQGLTDNIDGTDDFGMGSFASFDATWDGFRKGESNQGQITLGMEARWNWGTTEPLTLGAAGLGSAGFTANPFGVYTPTVIIRNLFWRQGSREAGWMYRIGRVTPDQFLSTSVHLSPLTMFTPIIGTGAFAMGISDSGIGAFGGFYLNDRVNIAGVVSDANANRAEFGQIREGDLFTAVELQVKVFPLTKRAGYSKLTFWNNDGTKFGEPLNGSTGNDGWGFFIKGEQELTCDGRLVGLLRYGKSYRDSAIYEALAAGHLVLYDPFNTGEFEKKGFNSDATGVAYNWIQPTASTSDRDESNFEFFYRFDLFPEMQATLSYQAIVNPANDPTNDYGSAFSFRLRSTW